MAPAGSYDVIIANGHLVDCTGNAWYAADVGICGEGIDMIVPAGLLAHAKATARIGATGRVVAPGFIDIQGQSAVPFTIGDGRAASKVSQGVATGITGEGSTPAPMNGAMTTMMNAPCELREDTLRAEAFSAFSGPRALGRWADDMQQNGTSLNVGSFLGAATVRVSAKGTAEGAANAAETDTMRADTQNAMRDGAFGVASALIYPPGRYAGTDELADCESDGTVRRRVRHAHAFRGLPVSGGPRRSDTHRTRRRRAGGDLSPQGRWRSQLADGDARRGDDRLRAGGRAGRCRGHVSVRRWRHIAHVAADNAAGV